jgi:hypothetical protein
MMLPFWRIKVRSNSDMSFLAIQLGLEGKVKLVDGFDKGKTGDLQGGLHPALFFGGHFFFEKFI